MPPEGAQSMKMCNQQGVFASLTISLNFPLPTSGSNSGLGIGIGLDELRIQPENKLDQIYMHNMVVQKNTWFPFGPMDSKNK